MTYGTDCYLQPDLLDQISSQGFELMPELIRIHVNAAMQGERQKYLKSDPYQRSEERQGMPTDTSLRPSRPA
jgi:putative transposase